MQAEKSSATLADRLLEIANQVGAAKFQYETSFASWSAGGCKDEKAYKILQGDAAEVDRLANEIR